MKAKSRKTAQGILKTGVMIPITDPAEQAELDRRCREAETALAGGRASPRKTRPRKGK
jgi:hypothetical protein